MLEPLRRVKVTICVRTGGRLVLQARGGGVRLQREARLALEAASGEGGLVGDGIRRYAVHVPHVVEHLHHCLGVALAPRRLPGIKCTMSCTK